MGMLTETTPAIDTAKYMLIKIYNLGKPITIFHQQ